MHPIVSLSRSRRFDFCVTLESLGLGFNRRSRDFYSMRPVFIIIAAGLAVVFPDSFSTRGLTGQCRVHVRKVRSSRERVADAHAARRWLQAQPWARKDRISLLGWSDGGIASLWAARARASVRDGMP